ncbi:hypothetical protein D3C78_1850550 [compost metagenome]
MLLMPTLLVSACVSQPSNWPPELVGVPQIPVLPSEAMQPAAPLWCSPSCSKGLMLERENWQRRMTGPE